MTERQGFSPDDIWSRVVREMVDDYIPLRSVTYYDIWDGGGDDEEEIVRSQLQVDMGERKNYPEDLEPGMDVYTEDLGREH